MKWHVQTVRVQAGVPEDMEKLNEILAEGWEPFAAGPSVAGHIFYLRQLYYPED